MEFDNIKNELKEIIKKRLSKRLKKICFELGESEVYQFYIGGNSLNEERPNDYDIYPVDESEYFGCDSILISDTKNSKTYKMSSGVILQMCKYNKSSLKDLIDSFDFAHIKVGALISISEDDFNDFTIDDIYISEDYIKSRVLGSSFYTGSEYPLSSLIRAFKYFERGNIKKGLHIIEVLKILKDIISRGYFDFEDYKDQLDAIDLNLILNEINGNEAFNLWEIIKETSIVKDE